MYGWTKFDALMGMEQSAVVGKPFSRFIQRDDQDVYYLHRQRVLESGDLKSFRLRLVKNDDSDFFANFECMIIRGSDSAPKQIRIVVSDITERKWAEEILRKYNEQLELEVRNRTAEIEKQCHQLEELNLFIKQMSSKTIKSMEDDRRSLSKEIHDSIGGSLAAIKMLLESRLQISDQPPNGTVMSLQKIIGHLEDTIEESRRISYQLRPLALNDFGLTTALLEYIKLFKTFYPKLEIVSQVDISNNGISDEIKTILYRVVQEALNNIGKHSGADFAKIAMSESQDQILLKIEDNGSGFEIAKVLNIHQPLKGYGMHSMKERVEICKGTFQVQSEPGKGTLLFASIPRAMF